MPTILDVAAKAGVGVGTVSRVLNDSPHVSDDTRAKVRTAIDALGYRPSAVARALSSGRSSALPVFAADVTVPSATARLSGILEVVDESHEVVLCQVVEPARRADFVDRHSTRLRAFGVLAISLQLEPAEIEAFNLAKVPVVSIDYLMEGVPSIVVDDVKASREATQYLLGLGHRDIGFIGDQPSGDYRSRASEDRLRGYRDALGSAGLGADPEIEATVVDSKRRAARQLLDGDRRPSAVVADADSTALCVLAVAREMGLSVPGDLSVIGFDDLWAADAAGLTTVSQPLAESGRLGARLLLEVSTGKEVPMVTELQTELIVRHTTAPPA